MPRSVDELSHSHTLPSCTNPFSSSSLSEFSSRSVEDASAAHASSGTPHHLAYSRRAFSMRDFGTMPLACTKSSCFGNLAKSNTHPSPVSALAPGAPVQKRNLHRPHGGQPHALVSTFAFPHTAQAMLDAPLAPEPLPGAPLAPLPLPLPSPFAAPLPFPLPPFAAPAYVSAAELTSEDFLAAPCTVRSMMATLVTSLSNDMRGSEFIADSSISHKRSRTIVEGGSCSAGGISLSMALNTASSSCDRREPSSE